MLGVCATFLAVERMRMGDSPAEAIKAVLERVDSSYEMKKKQQCALIVLRADGQWASGGLIKGFSLAVSTEEGMEYGDAQIVFGD
jgi:hypothetical protein